ncbi:MAG: peptide chain release factor 1 [candidate division WOR-3 bacterium]
MNMSLKVPNCSPMPDGLVVSDTVLEAHVQQLRARRRELERLLSDPQILGDPAHSGRLNREYREAQAFIDRYDQLSSIVREIAHTQEIMDQAQEQELADLARQELEELRTNYQKLRRSLLEQLIPQEPDWSKNCILEIRAAAGGEESALFAGDLYRMYCRYAETLGWGLEVLSSRPSELGGLRELVAGVSGESPYRLLRFESGVHRVQRVPKTEASGRIHTSTVTVAVLPEAEATDIRIDPSELRVEVFRAGGHGGQLVNKVESAVRITHIPTGIQASCQDDRSQIRNKAKAMRILLARIRDARLAAENRKLVEKRRSMVGTGERSEKIRTYNYPQNRVTDHRIGLTLHSLDRIIEGDLAPIHQALLDQEIQEWLARMEPSRAAI